VDHQPNRIDKVKVNFYRDLLVWQKAMGFVTSIYKITGQFPSDELYGLTSQIRRAAVSIPCNIAEGFGRNSRPEFSRFLQIANGSLFEVQTQIQVALNLNYININDYNDLMTDSREIGAMIKSLKESLIRQQKSNDKK
jgi:four helix bundle protein